MPGETENTFTAVDVPTQILHAAGNDFAYRTFGEGDDRPVVFFNHLAANLDNWDPAVIDAIGMKRRVVIFDNVGVGASSGAVPDSIEKMADDAALFIRALTDLKVDVIALSMGGMIAQELLVKYPELVHKIVLVGTGPRGGRGISKVSFTTYKSIVKALLAKTDPKEFIFFKRNNEGKFAAKEFLARLAARTLDKDVPISPKAFGLQLKAINKFGKSKPLNLRNVTAPVLVINGDTDIMVPTKLSYELVEQLQNSRLEIFPNSGHGSLFQHSERFVASTLKFLNE